MNTKATTQDSDKSPILGNLEDGTQEYSNSGDDTSLWFKYLTVAAVIAILLVSIVIRFWTRSDMWLDEAQTFNIAHKPLGQITHFLRQDGSPPLYYYLLHFWISLFGTSNLAARSLAGVISIITLVVAWFAGNSIGGRKVAWASLVTLACCPYAATYATTNRMYSLLTLEGLLAIWMAYELRRHFTLLRAFILFASVSLLIYTHYWSIFLIAAISLIFVYDIIWRRSKESLYGLVAILLAGLTFLPWFGDFLFQHAHTGTPWAQAPSLSAISSTVGQFAGGVAQPNAGGDLLKIIYLLLIALAIFGIARGSRRIELDLRTRPIGRYFALLFALTMVIGVGASKVVGIGFQARYSAVVFPAFMLAVAYAFLTFDSTVIRRSILGLTALVGIYASVPNITENRTQAPEIASVIRAHYSPGDVVAYCPDQLGPDTSRALLGLSLKQYAFPRGNSPEIVNWINYLQTVKSANLNLFIHKVLSAAGPSHTIWLVWMPNYRGFGSDCAAIADALSSVRHSQISRLTPKSNVYEPSYLLEFPKLSG